MSHRSAAVSPPGSATIPIATTTYTGSAPTVQPWPSSNCLEATSQLPVDSGSSPAAGGAISYPEAGSKHIDGPEYSLDGAWIYLNTEEFGSQPGHAQLARVPATGGALERLLVSDCVDWFPHLSPDGRHAAYISFPPGTLGHPADLEVEIRVVDVGDWESPLHSFALFGGQGTINVNSWSTDGRRFAYVAYPIASGERS